MNRAELRFTRSGYLRLTGGTKPKKTERRVALAKHANPFELTKRFGKVKRALVLGDNYCVFSEQICFTQEREHVRILQLFGVGRIAKQNINALACRGGCLGETCSSPPNIRWEHSRPFA